MSKTQSIEELEKEYPQLYQAFKDIQAEQYEMFVRKMASYGLHNISVGTNLETEQEVNLSLTSIWIRCMDKMQRLKQLVLLNKENPLENESADDAWKDLSVYSIIAQLVSKGRWKK